MGVAAAGVCLPDFDELAPHRSPKPVKKTPRYHQALADWLAAVLNGQIRFQRVNIAVAEARGGQLERFGVDTL
ncbi:hypothetical protein BZL29_1104 [Mycobacterium kansasii]|uniref:Uncharacterized protein n=1 Tax=Mycobacterium kansasii TaxID=1768 RepID=A0A1V3XWR8_MYCKA|nr:hypothetical protein BZL29_1104 [Mycobacterium kansasii]